jgi:hypothetical protein
MGEDAEDDQCAPTGMPVSRPHEQNQRQQKQKMIPAPNTWTNETIAACCWTNPVTAACTPGRRCGSAPDAR